MNKNILMILLAVGTITGILIGSLSYANAVICKLSNSGRHVPINTFLRILRNMILALEEWELQIIIVQEYTLNHRLEGLIFPRILCQSLSFENIILILLTSLSGDFGLKGLNL